MGRLSYLNEGMRTIIIGELGLVGLMLRFLGV